MRPTKYYAIAPMLLVAILLVLLPAGPASTDGEPIRLLSSSVVSEFPDGVRFRVEVSGENEIMAVAVRFRIGQQARGAYDYAEFEKGRAVDAELFWRTDTAARYIPPGTIITYNFEIEDSEGSLLATDPEAFIYHDVRFEWEEISQGPVSVAYHGPVRPRAEAVLAAIMETFDHMGPLLGADTGDPIRVTMYNNAKEMPAALPPGSATIRRELITEGQAFVNIGTLLILGSGSLARGTASHEVTHILTHRAGDSVFRSVPSWLDEGLAEYGNIEPGFSYDLALDFALATGRLLPITTLGVIPGNPEDVIIFYGEARSLVRFMVEELGPERMKELMATLKTGTNIDDALEAVYGIDRSGLENQWRASIGAPLYSPPDPGRARPTPIARPTFLPYSLTPQPGAMAASGTADTPTPKAWIVDTPTPQPTVAPTPTMEPTRTPVPEPEPTATPVTQPTPGAATPPTEARTPEAQEPGAQGAGGACNARYGGGMGATDVSAFLFLTGLAGLALRRRLIP